MKRLMPILFGVLILGGLILIGCSNKEEVVDMSVDNSLTELPTVIVCSLDADGEVSDSSLEVYEYNGKRYVFSSEACRETIMSDPDKYLEDDVN